MNEFLIVSLGLAAIAAATLLIRYYYRVTEWSSEIKHMFVSIGVDKQYWTPEHEYKTPKGVRVKSARPLPAQALAEIDNGIANQIRLYTEINPAWTLYTKHSDYDVYVIKPMTTNMDGSPAMYVKGWQSAGTMLGASQRFEAIDKRPVLVVVDQVDQNWAYMEYFRHSVHAESEHVREWTNLLNEPAGTFYYWATSGDVHPHTLVWGDEVTSLFTEKSAAVECQACASFEPQN